MYVGNARYTRKKMRIEMFIPLLSTKSESKKRFEEEGDISFFFFLSRDDATTRRADE